MYLVALFACIVRLLKLMNLSTAVHSTTLKTQHWYEYKNRALYVIRFSWNLPTIYLDILVITLINFIKNRRKLEEIVDLKVWYPDMLNHRSSIISNSTRFTTAPLEKYQNFSCESCLYSCTNTCKSVCWENYSRISTIRNGDDRGRLGRIATIHPK